MDAKLSEWEPDTVTEVKKRISEIIDLADQDALDTEEQEILKTIDEIVEKSAGRNHYIYRGEPKEYDQVASSLYRQVPRHRNMNFNMEDLQQQILDEAKEYVFEKNIKDYELLTEIQHFGGATNLIDFTEDYLIALFFACNGYPEEPGRVILLAEKPADYKIIKPAKTINRVVFQKSILVESSTGLIKIYPNRLVTIPSDLKQPMLNYLQKHHSISHKTIYNDLQGFIGHSAYAEVSRGFHYQALANDAKCWEDQKELFEQAIFHYTEAIRTNPKWIAAHYNRGRAYLLQRQAFNKAHRNDRRNFNEIDVLKSAIEDFDETIKLSPDHAAAYCNRGMAHYLHFTKKSYERAVKDYSTAIDLNPDIGNAYGNRGEVWLHLEKWEQGMDDLKHAQKMGMNISESFDNDYESLTAFEKKNEIQLPTDIKDLYDLAKKDTVEKTTED